MKKDIYQRKVILRGVVEGVGMRPALFRMARQFGLTGYVVNRSCEVELVLQGEKEAVLNCFEALPEFLPEGAAIMMPPEFHDSEPEKVREEFVILDSSAEPGKVNLLTPPDLAMCSECRAEVLDPADRRYGYPFNSCGKCGPRASLISVLPYDRDNTAWHDFPLCADCRREYGDPSNRRFHIEGISCPACGPRLTGESLKKAAKILESGGIIALKSVGGFQLLCIPEAAGKLRVFKNRPEKPLALMARSLQAVKKVCRIGTVEEELLVSPAAPIVLLEWTGEELAQINPDDSRQIGVMLPPSPLHELLFEHFAGDFLVATSGNRRSEVPALNDEEARERLDKVDGFLIHDRDIFWRHDDSLAVCNGGQAQYWRRARGCSWAVLSGPGFHRRVAAMGGALKNTFALADSDTMLLSPHHGDLEDAANVASWERALTETAARFPGEIEAVAVDLHPDYYSSRFGESFARRLGVPLVRVPHHYAHALAGLLESGRDRALALVFDGNGLGPDGALWGAELLFVSRGEGGCRFGSFESVPLPGGELAIREPYRQLAGRRYAAGLPAFTEEERFLFLQCETNLNAPHSHAAGRLFDAFAALSGLAPQRISYEGQCAVRLEAAARRERSGAPLLPWESRERDGMLWIDWTPLFLQERPDNSALSFHRSVAAAALEMVNYGRSRFACDTVILTGGVFQNRVLTGLVAEGLRAAKLIPFIPSRIPPNDGGIAAGQCCWAGLKFRDSGVHYSL